MNTVEKRVRKISSQLGVDLYELDNDVERIAARIKEECALAYSRAPRLSYTKTINEWTVRDICLNLVYEAPYHMTGDDAIRIIVCLHRGMVGWNDFRRHTVWVTAQEVKYSMVPRLTRKIIRTAISDAVFIHTHMSLPDTSERSNCIPVLIGAYLVKGRRPDDAFKINMLIAQIQVPRINGILHWAVAEALVNFKSEGRINDADASVILRLLA